MLSKKIYLILFLLSTLVTAFASSGCAPVSDKKSESLPTSWTQLPEEGAVDESEEEEVPSPEAEVSLNRILEANSNAFEDAEKTIVQTEKSRFGLKAILTDLSISIEGWLAPLFGKGTSSVTLVWRKKEAPAKSTGEISEFSEKGTISPRPTGPALGNSAQLLAQIADYTEKFRAMAKALEATPTGAGWYASRLRLDLGVDASGRLTPVFNIGSDVRIRFEWHRGMRISPDPRLGTRGQMDLAALETGMMNFSKAISNDLRMLTDANVGPSRRAFEATQYRVGFGITQTFDIAIAKAVRSVFGHLYFSRNPRTKSEVSSIDVDSEEGMLNILDAESDEKTLDYAKRENIPYTVEILPNGKRQIVFRVNRNAYRRGLRRALNISGFFTRVSSRATSGRWKIYEVKTGFEQSVSGASLLSTFKGIGSTEISFKNRNF